jgi:acetyl-CoA carboxylase carboxyl transferase subunit beta
VREIEPSLNGKTPIPQDGMLTSKRPEAPKDLAVKCEKCRELLLARDLVIKVCPRCGYHFRLTAQERINSIVDDPENFVEYDRDLQSRDPLKFVSRSQEYRTKLEEMASKTGLTESVITGIGAIESIPVSLAVMDLRFIGGSMGTVAGERLTRTVERGIEHHCPVIIFTASGGARMQESLFSLFQMTKTSAVLARLADAHQPYISVLTDPTTGGVTASFAALGDIILAEPGALIGFAGPVVIEQFMHQKLPSDTDTSEFMLAHGMIDAVVDRRSLRSTLGRILRFYR